MIKDWLINYYCSENNIQKNCNNLDPSKYKAKKYKLLQCKRFKTLNRSYKLNSISESEELQN